MAAKRKNELQVLPPPGKGESASSDLTIEVAAEVVSIGETGVATHIPKWTEVLSPERLDAMQFLFKKGMTPAGVAGIAGMPAMLLESWIATGELLGVAYATHISFMMGDFTRERALRILRDKRIPKEWLDAPPPKDARYDLAVAANRGTAELDLEIRERILKDGTPADLGKIFLKR